MQQVVVDEYFPRGLPETAEEAYEAVVDIANRVLTKCRLFSIEVLQNETPTITEIAKSLRVVATLIQDLDALGFVEDVMIPGKAQEYVTHIQQIANAIEAGNEEALAREIAELNKRSFLL